MSFQGKHPSIAVVLHLSNLNMWPQYCLVLQQLLPYATFFISTSIDKREAVAQLVKKDVADAHFYAFESRGRDFGALIALLKLVPLNQFDLVLKLHTGNTEFYSEIPNERWLKEIVQSLLPIGRLNYILNYFSKNSSVGLAGPRSNYWSLKKLFYNVGTVTHWNKLTLTRKPSEFPQDPYFIAGGMFWARGTLFKGLSDLNLSQADFEIDSPELDGTLAHALERYLPLIAHDLNLKVDGFYFNDFSQWLTHRKIKESERYQFEDFIASSHFKPTVQIIIKRQSTHTNESLELSLSSIADATTCGVKVNVEVWEAAGSDSLSRFSNGLIKNNSFDFFLIINAGDEFTPYGLLLAYVEMIKQPNGHAFYSDKMLRTSGGVIESAFLPDSIMTYL